MVRLELRGVLSQNNVQYIEVTRGQVKALLNLTQLCLDEGQAKSHLVRSGIIIVGRIEWNRLKERVQNVAEFDPETVIETIGWNGDSFALPDGTVLSPNDRVIPIAVSTTSRGFGTNGTLPGWKKSVAAPLAGQHLAAFILMATFVAPILRLSQYRGNFGFEVVGPKGTGKSTLLHLAASAVGGVEQCAEGHFWTTLDTTVNGLEETMRVSSDLPMLMDEANLLAAEFATRERAKIFKAVAFKLSSGTIKQRFGTKEEADYRLAFVMTSNEPLDSLVGRSSENARAAADRLITLPLDKSRSYGVFDDLPARYESSSELARNLLAAAGQHHGHAFRRFIACLVSARSKDEKDLRRKITIHVDNFRKLAGVDLNDGSQVRVADAFGMVFAAGKLARKFRVLPKGVANLDSVLTCYRMHLAHRNGEVAQPFADRLAVLMQDPGIVRWKAGEKGLKKALGVIKAKRGDSELLISPNKIKDVFPDWASIMRTPEVERYLKRDGNHMTVKRKLGSGGTQRLHAFDVSTITESG